MKKPIGDIKQRLRKKVLEEVREKVLDTLEIIEKESTRTLRGEEENFDECNAYVHSYAIVKGLLLTLGIDK